MNLSVRRALILTAWVSCVIAPVASVAADGASGAVAPEAHQFDFLVGRWQVSGAAKVSGVIALFHGQPKLGGSWTAWRSADGEGIEDDLTLTDASGATLSTVHFTRRYSRTEKCWIITGRAAAPGAAPTPATASRLGDQMLMTSNGTTPEGKSYRNRTHYLAITPVSFRLVQDRSYDDGKTWDIGAVTLDLLRTGN